MKFNLILTYLILILGICCLLAVGCSNHGTYYERQLNEACGSKYKVYPKDLCYGKP